ncbi:MAG TPA: hypothetical protein VEF04_22380 [Blastocatellia bacterium]|nr:hypothetical protein [Blastocatellia bacterium]
MYTVYRMKANELDARFLRALKALFKDKEIEIAVCETTLEEEDETTYLLKSPANRERLMQAIANVAQGQELIMVKPDDVQ